MLECPVFLGESYLGDALRSWAFSTYYLCPECGDIWARILAPGKSQYGVLIRNCKKHWGSIYEYPPILFDDQRYENWTTILPREAKLHDLTILRDLYEHPSETP